MDQQADGHLDPDLSRHLRDRNKEKKAFEGLEGFKIQTGLDRKLVLGCWKQEDDPKSVTAKITSVDRNLSDLSNQNNSMTDLKDINSS